MASATLRSIGACRPSVCFPSPFLVAGVWQHRAFSATACAWKVSGPLPSFEPTSNPELDDVLNTVRDELFIPIHLLRRHRNLVYRKKYHHLLEEEPLELTVGGKSVVLRPKDRQAPVRAADFTRALSLMKEPSDLDAIPDLLLGFAQAERHLKEKHFEKMARVINRAGRADLMLSIMRKREKLGFQLTRPITREFMRGLLIQHGIGTKESAVKAVSNAEQLIQMSGGYWDKRDPVLLGTALAIAAKTQIRFNDGMDHNDVTKDYAVRFRRVWMAVEWEQELVDGEKSSVHKAKIAVLDYAPVLDGLQQAAIVLSGDKNDATWLRSKSRKLAKAVGTWNAFLEKNRTLLDDGTKLYGPHVYEEVAAKLAEKMAEKTAATEEKTAATEEKAEAEEEAEVEEEAKP